MKELHEMKVAELKALAKELCISNWWNMKKEKLIKAIEEKESNTKLLDEEKDAPEVNVDALEHVNERKNKKRLIEYQGKTQTLTAWAKELGIRHQTLYNRIVIKGMNPIEAFKMPIKKGVNKNENN